MIETRSPREAKLSVVESGKGEQGLREDAVAAAAAAAAAALSQCTTTLLERPLINAASHC